MVSDEQIIERIGELLAKADLTITTTSTIRRQLEQDLHIDLSNRKVFVREQVDLYLQTHPQNQQGDEAAAEEEAAHEGEVGAEEAVGDERKAVKAEEETAQEGDNKDVEEEDEEEEEEEDEEEEEKKPEQDTKRLQAKIDRVKKNRLKHDFAA